MSGKRFSKVYVEITNTCNLSCSFCHGTRRAPDALTPERFSILADKLRPYTDYLYLHVLGEPLSHPHLWQILDACAARGYHTSLTTNGTLLPENTELLLSHAETLYKISISLHAFEANRLDPLSYVSDCAAFAARMAECGTIISLRLWNLDGSAASAAENKQNDAIVALLHEKFPTEWEPNRSGMKIAPRIYLEWGEKFDWPDMNAKDYGAKCYCHGLSDQIGVLVDGTVVPCCLDAEGDIALGNLFTQDLGEILQNPRTVAIADGFAHRRAVEALCRRCGYARRF